MESTEVIEALKKCGLFGDLSENELATMTALAHLETFKPGDVVYQQGQRGEKIYILAEGQISLHRAFEVGGNRQAEKMVYVLRESPNRRLLGNWSTLVGEPHPQMCTAKCVKPTKLVSFNSAALRELIAKNPQIQIKILEKLVVILRERLESSYSSMDTL